MNDPLEYSKLHPFYIHHTLLYIKCQDVSDIVSINQMLLTGLTSHLQPLGLPVSAYHVSKRSAET